MQTAGLHRELMLKRDEYLYIVLLNNVGFTIAKNLNRLLLFLH